MVGLGRAFESVLYIQMPFVAGLPTVPYLTVQYRFFTLVPFVQYGTVNVLFFGYKIYQTTCPNIGLKCRKSHLQDHDASKFS